MVILLVLPCALVIVGLIKFSMLQQSNVASECKILEGDTTSRTNHDPTSDPSQCSLDSNRHTLSKLPWPSKVTCRRLKYSRHVEMDKSGKYTQINQYLLTEFIGQGSYGIVQLAYNKFNNQNYAMKILSKKKMLKRAGFFGRLAPQRNRSDKGNSGTGSTSHPLDRIYREINVLKKLNHPNIVKLVEVIDDPVQDNLYLAFELLDLGPVVSDAPDGNAMEENQARMYFRDLLLGIEYLHRNHVVHRDIKPANLLLGCDGRLRIADFGVSCEFHGAEDIVLETTAGTPAFHAPEELGVGKFHGKAADIWAVGVTLYFFVYGALPFHDTNVLALHKLIQHQELTFPAGNSTSAQLKDLLGRLLHKEPSRRITVSEIKEHSWVTCDGTWLFQEEAQDSLNIERLYPVFSIPSVSYLSSLTRLMKTMFLSKHSFRLSSFKFT